MTDTLDDRYWSIARRRRDLLEQLAALDAEMAALDAEYERRLARWRSVG